MASQHFHLIGIGGAGMSAIAEVLLAHGHSVSGSDQRDSDTLRRLARLGAQVHVGHRTELPPSTTTVVRSDAIPDSNPEVCCALDRALPLLSRATALDRVLRDHKTVAVTGTHGKTTTTGMVSCVLEAAGLDPLTLIGGDLGPQRGTARVGQGAWAVAEACEAFNAFLCLHPLLAVITNIEPDHLDYHGSFENLLGSFRRFTRSVPQEGLLVGCADDPHVSALMSECDAPTLGYGLRQGTLTTRDLRSVPFGSHYTLVVEGREVAPVELPVPGDHNVLNSLAALAVARFAGLDLAEAARSLAGFEGVKRRFETLGSARGIRVVDDYAHHPTEMAATLRAARDSVAPQRLVLAFQPHLYSRTRQFLDQFADALMEPDLVVLTDVYAAREAPPGDITGETLFRAARQARGERPTLYVEEMRRIPEALAPELKSGDLVIVMGAGDIREAGEALVACLQ